MEKIQFKSIKFSVTPAFTRDLLFGDLQSQTLEDISERAKKLNKCFLTFLKTLKDHDGQWIFDKVESVNVSFSPYNEMFVDVDNYFELNKVGRSIIENVHDIQCSNCIVLFLKKYYKKNFNKELNFTEEDIKLERFYRYDTVEEVEVY